MVNELAIFKPKKQLRFSCYWLSLVQHVSEAMSTASNIDQNLQYSALSQRQAAIVFIIYLLFNTG